MLRKISGSGFAVAMILIIAMKHAAFGFCLCQDQLILSDCGCREEAVLIAPSCSCCEQSDASIDSEASPGPCSDCLIPLSIDPGEFNWSANAFSPLEQDGIVLDLPLGLEHELPPAPLAQSVHPSRGPPPGGPPLFLRTTVLRL